MARYLVKRTKVVGTTTFFVGKLLDDLNFDIPAITQAGVELLAYPNDFQLAQAEVARTDKLRGRLGIEGFEYVPEITPEAEDAMDKTKTYEEITSDVNAVTVGGSGSPATRIRVGIGGDVEFEYGDGTTDVVTYNSGDVDALRIFKILAEGTTAKDITLYWG